NTAGITAESVTVRVEKSSLRSGARICASIGKNKKRPTRGPKDWQGGNDMSIYKRGKIYWYKFTFNGEAIRESTRQTNQHTARDIESAHRSSLAKGEVGIRDKKQSLTLA